MIIYGVHWHKYYLSARIKYKSATARADATVNVWLLFTYIYLARNSDKYCGICFNRDRAGLYAEI